MRMAGGERILQRGLRVLLVFCSEGQLAKHRDYTYWPGARFAQEFLAHGGNSQETQRAACENRAGKFRDDVLELTGGLGKTQENFSAKEFLGHPKGRA